MHRRSGPALAATIRRQRTLSTGNPLLAVFALASLALSGCRGTEPRLVILARSDLTPYEEVDRIDVALVGVGTATETAVSRSATLREGLTVYDRSLATLNGRHVRVTFFFDGAEIARRDLVFDHTTDLQLVVDVPRLCVDAGCDDGETCVLGQCASARCVVGTETDCPEPMCTRDDECSVHDIPCASGACAGGACLAYGDGESCAAHEWCDPFVGCRPGRAQASVDDSGARDSGEDAGDAGAAMADAYVDPDSGAMGI